MDPLTGAVVIAGLTTMGKPTAEALTAAVGKIIGPSLDALGEGVAAPLKEWAARRSERAGATLLEAGSMLVEQGIEPEAVPGRVLWPILEGASREEDLDLRHKWSALLANAASPGKTSMVLPAYAEILRQLTPVQALMMDAIYKNSRHLAKEGVEPPVSLIHQCEDGTIQQEVPACRAHYHLLAADLHRLRLIEGQQREFSSKVSFSGGTTYSLVKLTVLGIEFMRAVNPPGAFLGGITMAKLEERKAKRAEAQRQYGEVKSRMMGGGPPKKPPSTP